MDSEGRVLRLVVRIEDVGAMMGFASFSVMRQPLIGTKDGGLKHVCPLEVWEGHTGKQKVKKKIEMSDRNWKFNSKTETLQSSHL